MAEIKICNKMQEKGRKGKWLQTYTGIKFWALDPRPEDISLEDLAQSLSLMCRYNGHVKQFYSVAQHSVLISRYVKASSARWGLLHDAAEAYVSDVPKPLKESLPEWTKSEALVLKAVAKRFNLGWPEPKDVKEADVRILLDEKHVLIIPSIRWPLEDFAKPLGIKINPWSPKRAKVEFLKQAQELGLK